MNWAAWGMWCRWRGGPDAAPFGAAVALVVVGAGGGGELVVGAGQGFAGGGEKVVLVLFDDHDVVGVEALVDPARGLALGVERVRGQDPAL